MIRLIASNYINYLRVAPLPHLVLAVCVFTAAVLIYCALGHYREENPLGFLIFSGVAVSWLTGAFFSVADIVSRYREYQRIRHILAERGYSEKIFVAVASSRCQRDAAMWAARQTGHCRRVRELYRALGYRWYHLFPDVLMKNPLLIFTPGFLRKAFVPGKRIRQS